MRKAISMSMAALALAVCSVMFFKGCGGNPGEDTTGGGTTGGGSSTPLTGPFYITATASPAGGGTITRTPEATRYNTGTEVTLTANAASGYSFLGWSGSESAETNSIKVIADGDMILTASFLQQPTEYCCWPGTSENGWTDACAPIGAGYDTKSAAACKNDYGIVSSTSVTPAVQYCDWGAGGCWPIWDPNGPNYDEQGVATGKTNLGACQAWGKVCASAKACPSYGGSQIQYYTLTTSASPSAGGQVTRNPSAVSYASGTQVTVTATPASGYLFRGWTGASGSSDNSVTITITGNLSLTGLFELQQTPPPPSSTGSGGSGGSDGGNAQVRFDYTGGVKGVDWYSYRVYIGSYRFSAPSNYPKTYSGIPAGTYDVKSYILLRFNDGTPTKDFEQTFDFVKFEAGKKYTFDPLSGKLLLDR